MGRALAWLGLGLLGLLLVVALLAPVEVGAQALVLAGVMVLPGVLVLAVTASVRRRRTRHDPGPR